MPEINSSTSTGDSLTDLIINQWHSEHKESEDLCISDARELRDLMERAIGHSTGVELVAIERARQISHEGYSREHDRKHGAAQLAQAAQAYLTGSAKTWPWTPDSFKPSADISRNLVRAGALIAAAIDVLTGPIAG